MQLTAQEFTVLNAGVRAFGGELVERGLGFAPRSELDPDCDFVKGADYVDFVPPGSAEGNPLQFSELPGNQIHAGLEKLDGSLTPARGLRRLNDAGALVPLESPVRGRSLLLIHGTFSNSESIVASLLERNDGFVRWALQKYEGRVLSYDYATLSQHALTSALRLRHLLAEAVEGPIDVISHSQGGLVTRFWLEALDPSRLADTRAIFVAGTLAGTSLAAPWAIRRALRAVANVAWVLAKGSGMAVGAVPFFGVVSGLFGLLQKSTKFLSHTSVVDAGVALIPGFNGMSQVATNADLRELQAQTHSVPAGYFAVTGDFQPVQEDWTFWKHLYSRVANAGSDLLFSAPNDLVVDTAAMTHLADGKVIPKSHVHHFAAGVAHVHHTNYFEQASTADTIRGWLEP